MASNACVGDIGHGSTNDSGQAPNDNAPQCTAPAPGAAPIRRLNKTEYELTIQGLFGQQDSTVGFPEDKLTDGYDNAEKDGSLSQLRVDKMFAASEAVAEAASQDLTNLLSCAPNAIDDACVDGFISQVGRRSYRRPLSAEEHALLRTVYDADPTLTVAERIADVLQSMLMAPQFVFRPEIGDGNQVTPGVVALTGYEIASRLSYLMWASTPDEQLLSAAAAGNLSTPEGIATEARRLLEDPKARRGVVNFLMQWLDLHKLESKLKDAELYPSFGPDLASAMREQTRRFFERVVFEQKGSIRDLLLSNEVEVNALLAQLYGVPHPGGEQWVVATLPENERKGILSQAAFLTTKAHPVLQASIQRGKFIRIRLLCQDIPDPPDNADTSPPELGMGQTNREILETRTSAPECASCHAYMNPLGFAFENFDAIGGFRTLEPPEMLPVNSSGEVVHSDDIDGPFDNHLELIDKLAASQQIGDCMTRQVFRYSFGRRADESLDKCDMTGLLDANRVVDGAILELLVAITQSDGFRFRMIEEGN